VLNPGISWRIFIFQFESGNEVSPKSHPALETKDKEEDLDSPIRSADLLNEDGGTYFKAEMYSSISVYDKDEDIETNDLVGNNANSGQVENFTVNSNEDACEDDESFHDILESFHSEDSWSVSSTDKSPEQDREPVDGQRGCDEIWSQCLWTRFRPRNKPGWYLKNFLCCESAPLVEGCIFYLLCPT